jgi:hypothetical protein
MSDQDVIEYARRRWIELEQEQAEKLRRSHVPRDTGGWIAVSVPDDTSVVYTSRPVDVFYIEIINGVRVVKMPGAVALAHLLASADAWRTLNAELLTRLLGL